MKNKSSAQALNMAVYLLLIVLLMLFLLPGCSSDYVEDMVTVDTEEPQESDVQDGGEIYINMDCKESSLPKRFRKCTDTINNEIGDSAVDLSGLDELMMSGSGQFSQDGLELVKQEIGDYSIVIVDFREESHGFINGIAFSYMDELNRENQGKTLEEIKDDENAKLDSIIADGFIVFPTDNDTRVDVVEVMTEQTLVESEQMSYLRLPVSNNLKPTDEIVDTFIAFVRSLPEETWVHFHCMEGVGRTTTFMFMYDAMHNAKTVSLDDIMTRQVLLGGKNLLYSGNKERAEFIEEFYNYCKENNDGYQTSWSLKDPISS